MVRVSCAHLFPTLHITLVLKYGMAGIFTSQELADATNRAPILEESVVSHLASHTAHSPVSVHHQVSLTLAPKWVKKPPILCLNLQHPGARPCQLTLNSRHAFHMLTTSLCRVLPLPSLKLCRAPSAAPITAKVVSLASKALHGLAWLWPWPAPQGSSRLAPVP